MLRTWLLKTRYNGERLEDILDLGHLYTADRKIYGIAEGIMVLYETTEPFISAMLSSCISP
jgi:hypothetical protein